MVVQSTSPYYATNAFWCINRTIESEGFNVLPYHLEVPSFGDWGFNLASRKELDGKFNLNVDTKYLTDEKIGSMFQFGKDEMPKKEICVNTLSKPVLMKYYIDADKKWK